LQEVELKWLKLRQFMSKMNLICQHVLESLNVTLNLWQGWP